ncbi:Disease resistance protein RPS2 [Camellia lanceoleosa]|uniref:Disease resistance protein RPS2 n=1 Tax=Camellia lanceoleosa TaxID=1840588 RepID=A0ACC0IHM4_9ERIC|nr:Disease resistance protein RPS2 [Camellia lanceoleosa]
MLRFLFLDLVKAREGQVVGWVGDGRVARLGVEELQCSGDDRANHVKMVCVGRGFEKGNTINKGKLEITEPAYYWESNTPKKLHSHDSGEIRKIGRGIQNLSASDAKLLREEELDVFATKVAMQKPQYEATLGISDLLGKDESIIATGRRGGLSVDLDRLSNERKIVGLRLGVGLVIVRFSRKEITKMTDKLPHSPGKESSEIILLAGKELEDASLLFFHDMSALHVLDLSYTSVNSLPQSMSRLNALQKLILRGCDFLMELPRYHLKLENLQILRFIVGPQVERFLSRLPREVEEEFNNLEKSEKGLKYVNGEGIPIEIIENMESICQGSVGKGCLSNLKFLALHTCLSLTTIFTVGMLRNLANLEELIVEDCTKISSLVDLKYSDSKYGQFLPNLKKILLLELPKLVSISNGLCIAPKLERMVIFFCPKLVKLSTMEVSSKDLKVIKGENEWWGALKWHESDLSSDHQDYLASVFVPLRRDGDLMAQFTKD